MSMLRVVAARRVCAAGVMALLSFVALSAQTVLGDVIVTSSTTPVPLGIYTSQNVAPITFGGGSVPVSLVSLTITDPPAFDVFFDISLDVDGTLQMSHSGPETATSSGGSVQTIEIVPGTPMGSVPGTITVPGPLYLRAVSESGEDTTVTPLGGGEFRIHSFFDVFTELSLDGGNTWIPSDSPAQMSLTSVAPLPTTASVGGTLLAAMALLRRCRRFAA